MIMFEKLFNGNVVIRCIGEITPEIPLQFHPMSTVMLEEGRGQIITGGLQRHQVGWHVEPPKWEICYYVRDEQNRILRYWESDLLFMNPRPPSPKLMQHLRYLARYSAH